MQSVEVAFASKTLKVFTQVSQNEVQGTETFRVSTEKLTTLPDVKTVVKVGDKWRLYTEDPSALLPHILQFAETHGLRIVSLNTLAPSLEDVFLQITGQQIGVVQNQNTPKRPEMRRGKGSKK